MKEILTQLFGEAVTDEALKTFNAEKLQCRPPPNKRKPARIEANKNVNEDEALGKMLMSE